MRTVPRVGSITADCRGDATRRSATAPDATLMVRPLSKRLSTTEQMFYRTSVRIFTTCHPENRPPIGVLLEHAFDVTITTRYCWYSVHTCRGHLRPFRAWAGVVITGAETNTRRRRGERRRRHAATRHERRAARRRRRGIRHGERSFPRPVGRRK